MRLGMEGGNLQKLYEQKYLTKNTITSFHNKFLVTQ